MQCHKCNSLDLFEAYVRERENAILLRVSGGFAIYKSISPEYGYLQDMFVEQKKRRAGVGLELLAKTIEVAKNSNKKALLTSTDISTNNVSDSVKAILSNGFRIFKLEDTVIWYILEI